MIYLSENDIKRISINWLEIIDIVEYSIGCVVKKDYVQPLKPYLRFKDLKNRIIAMPAYIGGSINMAGIKWIASFPDNVTQGIPRAHNIVILNDTKTGVPIGILNSPSISAIRTASVSGLIISQFLKNRKTEKINVGIVGLGPIGQHHLNMCSALLKDKCSKYLLYDPLGVDGTIFADNIQNKIIVKDSWEKTYSDADIFITCTVSKERYIDKEPKPNSLHLNVSLRDYKAEVFNWFKDAIIVDDWDEVCRENTDVEKFHKEKGLQKEDVKSFQDLVFSDYFDSLKDKQAVMFNPMGMAIFDIAISEYYIRCADSQKIGTILET